MDVELQNIDMAVDFGPEDVFIELRRHHLRDPEHLTRLNLQNRLIFCFEHNVFEHLVNLESIDLSGNIIDNIDDDLFKTNVNLKTINLKNNHLTNINKVAFMKLTNLEILDFSFNQITEIQSFCLSSKTLKSVNFAFNRITIVSCVAFYSIPNLVTLDLNHNKIPVLHDRFFFVAHKLRNIKLNDNCLTTITPYLLVNLKKLDSLQLQNNRIQSIDQFTMIFNKRLTVLNLSNNNILNISQSVFYRTPQLRILKLTVLNTFTFSSIKKLDKLLIYKLEYRGSKIFSFRDRFISRYIATKPQLSILTLIFEYFNISYPVRFGTLKTLSALHIECSKPQPDTYPIHLIKQFQNMAYLKKLVLKNLNHSVVFESKHDSRFGLKSLKYLDLTGLQNYYIHEIPKHFELLEYLNLSFSKVDFNRPNSNIFQYLTKLKFLHLEHSDLKSINVVLFANNTKLKFLNCANCRIEEIEDFSFQNTTKLEILVLRNNCIRTVTDYTFFGISNQAKINLDGNPIEN